MTETMQTSKERLSQAIEKAGLSVKSTFVPFSQSRNKDDKQPSLNWKVTLVHNGKDVLTTDYMAGCAHCPSYQHKMDYDSKRALAYECENGKTAKHMKTIDTILGGKAILPDSTDLIWSLLQDASVLNYGSFEEWASDLGYDADSRKAETIYKQCLAIALKIKNSIGQDAMSELIEAGSDH